jgi:hypothetical protein
MNERLIPLTALLISAFVALFAEPCSAQPMPGFLEIGKSYTLSSQGGSRFKVIEIGQDGWIKVLMQMGHQIAWININQVVLLTPWPPQHQ